MFMRGKRKYYTLKKTSLKAFTLIECLVSLLVISGAILVYNGLTQSISANVHYLSENQEENWLLFYENHQPLTVQMPTFDWTSSHIACYFQPYLIDNWQVPHAAVVKTKASFPLDFPTNNAHLQK